MANIPELSDSTKRRLALQWSALLDASGFTGGHLFWHEQEMDRLRRIAAQMGPVRGQRWNPPVLHDRAVDEIGIPQTVAVAEGRFKALSGEYWRHWLNSGDGHEAFAESLEELKRNVSAEVGLIWKGRPTPIVAPFAKAEIVESEDPYDRYETEADSRLRNDLLDGTWLNRWYPRACGPAVEKTLTVLVKEGTNRARGAELKRLETGKKPNGDFGKRAAETGSHEPQKASDTEVSREESTGAQSRPDSGETKKRLRATMSSPTAVRRVEAYMESHGGQTKFATKVGTTDRTLRSFRKTGRVRWDIFEAIAGAMDTTPDELLRPE